MEGIPQTILTFEKNCVEIEILSRVSAGLGFEVVIISWDGYKENDNDNDNSDEDSGAKGDSSDNENGGNDESCCDKHKLNQHHHHHHWCGRKPNPKMPVYDGPYEPYTWYEILDWYVDAANKIEREVNRYGEKNEKHCCNCGGNEGDFNFNQNNGNYSYEDRINEDVFSTQVIVKDELEFLELV